MRSDGKRTGARGGAWGAASTRRGRSGPFADPTSLPPLLIGPDQNAITLEVALGKVIERGPIGRMVNRSAEQRHVDDPESCVLRTSPPFETFLRPPSKARQPRDPRIQEGIRLSLAMLREISEEAARHGIPVLVVLFPSKAAVYQDLLVKASQSGESGETHKADKASKTDKAA